MPSIIARPEPKMLSRMARLYALYAEYDSKAVGPKCEEHTARARTQRILVTVAR